MRRLLTVTCIFAASLAWADRASAAILTFDDVTTNTGSGVAVPNGYGGLNWANFNVNYTPNMPSGSGYVAGTISGDYVAYNVFGSPAAVSDGEFTFNSAYLTAAWNTGLNVTVTGLLGATQLYQTTLILDPTAPTLFAPNWSGIDTLTFVAFGGVNAGLGGSGTQFAIDNFTYNEAVPEPATLSLIALSLAGLGARRRWQREV